MDISQQYWVEKTLHGVETHWLSGKENVPGTTVSTKVMLLGPENILKKDVTLNNDFNWKLRRQNLLFLETLK